MVSRRLIEKLPAVIDCKFELVDCDIRVSGGDLEFEFVNRLISEEVNS
jgi:hypothetical protein